MKNISVRTRLMVWNVFAVLGLTVALGFAVSWRVRADLTANVDKELKTRVESRVGFMGPGPGGPPPGMGPRGQQPRQIEPPGQPEFPPGEGPGQPMEHHIIPMHARMHLAPGPFRPRVFDEELRPATQFNMDVPWDKEGAKRAIDGQTVLTTVNAEGELQRVISAPFQDGGPARVVQYAHPLSETERAILGVNHTLLAMLPLAMFVAGLGGYYLTDRALRPVSKLASAAEQVSGDNIAGRLPVQGNDEFAQLAGTINSMLDRLEAAFKRLTESVEKEKRFTGDASHELRSPLTAIKANASLALSTDRGAEQYKEALVEIDRSATRMGELIDDLLLLARADGSGLFGSAEPLDLRALIEELPLGGRAVQFEIDESAAPGGNRRAVSRLFANLLSNAFRHTPAEGQVVVRSRRSGDRVEVEVRDEGEGIAPEHLGHLGERFYRIDSARARSAGGVGLGLAICKSIVEAHGGELGIESKLGEGTTVRFTLPGPVS